MKDNSSGEWKVIGETLIKNDPVPTKDTTKIAGIYGLKNKTTGKWYIGQSFDIVSRWKNYEKLKCKKQRHLYNALKKYGVEDFDKVLIEPCEAVGWIMDYREMYWIKIMNTLISGYNLTEGGNGGKKSEETRKRMSDSAKKRKPVSQEVRDTLSRMAKERLAKHNPHIGAKRSQETKNKISELAKIRYKDPTKNPMYGRRKHISLTA